MKASKPWGMCSCGCNKPIREGDDFFIDQGDMLLVGHDQMLLPYDDETPEQKITIPAMLQDLPMFM